jgi:hypothetical protein
MTEKKRVITRRDFLRAGSYVVMGSLMGVSLPKSAPAGETQKSKVVLIRDDKVVNGNSLRPDILGEMFDQAVSALFDTKDPQSVWQQLVKPADIVGIKSNVWRPLPTPAALEERIMARLIEVGVEAHNISVDDRGLDRNPVFKNSTALINIRPMRTHHWSGLGTLLKNYIMFAVKGKTRLNILVMLTPLFHGVGPHHFSRRYLWTYGGLIVSADPVAADATGARIIQSKRNEYFGEDKPISPPPRHIEAADIKYALGNSHPDRIELIKLGWEKDIFI